MTVSLTSNTIRAIRNSSGVGALTSTGSANLNLTMRSNDIDIHPFGGGAFPLSAVFLNSGALMGDTATFCADLTGNTAFIGDGAAFADSFFVQGAGGDGVGADPVLQLVGYGGADNDVGAINTFLGTTATTVTPAPGSAFGGAFPGPNSDIVARATACPTP